MQPDVEVRSQAGDSLSQAGDSRSGSRMTSRETVTVTKVVRRWSVDYTAKGVSDDKENGGAENSPSKMLLAAESSLMPTAPPMHVQAETLVFKGMKRRPTRGQSMTDFMNSVTHLHLDGQGLAGGLEPLKLCINLQVLYLYDNKLTSLRGLGSLKKLTHLYAQNNEIESLDDFVAPPSLEQLFLNGNRIVEVRGLQETYRLKELHLANQRRHTPPPPPPAEWSIGAPPPPPSRQPAAEPVRFDQESLFAVAPTLQTLDASGCYLDDDAIELLVVFQELERLELARNALGSVDRLQQLVARLPQLQRLKLAGNPLVSRPKFRERIVLASRSLHELDGKPVHQHERQFLTSMVMQGGARGVRRGASAAAQQQQQQQQRRPTLSREGRPPSIESCASRPLAFEGIGGAVPAGMRPGSEPPISRGARGVALPNSRSAASSGVSVMRGHP